MTVTARGNVFKFAVLFFSAFALASTSTLSTGAGAKRESFSANEVPPPGTYTVEAPVFRVGDFWKYRYLNKEGGFTQFVTEVKDKEVHLSSEGKTIILSREGNVILGYGPVTGKATTYNPPIPRLQFPLWVGKKWISSYTARSGSWSKYFTLGVTVVSRERIEVSAGSFDTLKLEFRFSTGNQQLCWYAEVVKRFVKCEYTDPERSYELESFRLAEEQVK